MSSATKKTTAPGIPFKAINQHEPDSQQALVIQGAGRSLVVNAGAGTGKTGTLTTAFVDSLLTREINGEPLLPKNILAITYTKAAAEELKERVSGLLRNVDRPDLVIAMDEAWISTFHSFCQRILTTHAMRVAELFNVDPVFRTIEDSVARVYQAQAFTRALEVLEGEDQDAYNLLTDDMNEENLKKSLNESLLASQVHQVDAGNMTIWPSDFEPLDTWEERAVERLEAFKMLHVAYENAYKSIKQENDVIDFSDQIHYVQRLFDEAPDILEVYREQFGIIFIDEFQDTNFVQLEIFKKLSSGNLAVVGDGRQSIYAFQGANAQVFSSMLSGYALVESPEEFEKATSEKEQQPLELRLSHNYRSHKDIIGAVNHIFSHNLMFGDDFVQLTAKREAVPDGLPEKKRVAIKPYVGNPSTNIVAEKGATWIAQEFRELRDRGGYSPSDMVILVRTRSKAQLYMDALKKEGFEAVLLGGEKLYKDSVVLQAISMLKLVDNPLDNGAFVKAAISIFGDVADTELAALETMRLNSDVDGDVEKYYSLALGLGDTAPSYPTLQRFSRLISDAVAMRNVETPANVLRYIISSSGIDELLLAIKGPSNLENSYEQSYVNLATVVDEIEEMQRLGSGFREVVIGLQQRVETGKGTEELRPPLPHALGAESEAVRIMTIHSSKGLEFPIVAVPVGPSSVQSGEIRTHFKSDEDTGASQVVIGAKVKLTNEETDIAEQRKKDGVTLTAMGIKGTPRKYFTLDESVKHLADETAHDEEMRLLYVAMTRARERLIISYAISTKNLKAHPDKLEKTPNTLIPKLHKALIRPEYAQLDAKSYDDGVGTDIECDFDASELAAEFAPTQEIEPEVSSEAAIRSEDGAANGSGETSASPDSAQDEATAVPEVPRVSIPLQPVYTYSPMPEGLTQSRRSLIQITATDIDRYATCPRQYRFRSVLRLGEISKPKTEPGATEFGTAMHAVLEDGIQRARKGLDAIASEAIARVAAQNRLNPLQADRLSSAAVKVTQTRYWARASTAPEAYPEAQFFEQLFDAEGNEYFINGFIDLLVFEKDGTALVVDYKSGEWEGARQDHYLTQATVYAFAALRRGVARVEVVFLRPEVADASTGVEEFKFEFSSEEMDSIAATLLKEKEKMELAGLLTDEDIRAHVQGKDVCERCSFMGQLCPGYE